MVKISRLVSYRNNHFREEGISKHLVSGRNTRGWIHWLRGFCSPLPPHPVGSSAWLMETLSPRTEGTSQCPAPTFSTVQSLGSLFISKCVHGKLHWEPPFSSIILLRRNISRNDVSSLRQVLAGQVKKRGSSWHQEISQPPGIVACASARNWLTFDLDVYGRNPKLDCTLYTIPNAHS